MNKKIKKLRKITCYSFIEKNDFLYSGNLLNNAICRIDRISGNSEILYRLPEVLYCKENSFPKVAETGGKILFFPQYGNSFYIYDIEKNSMSEIPIILDSFEATDDLRFWEVTAYDGFFYVFGYRYPGIIRIHADTFEIKYLNSFVNRFENDILWNNTANRYYFADGCMNINNKLYIPTGIDHTIFCLDTDTDKYEFVRVESGIKKQLSVSDDGEYLWCTDSDELSGRIAIYHPSDMNVKELIFPSKGAWYAPVFYGKYAYFLPMYDGSTCYRVNTDTLKPEVFTPLDMLFHGKSTSDPVCGQVAMSVLALKLEKERLIFIRRPDYTWFTYDFATDELTSVVYEITDEEYINNLEKDYYDRLFDRDHSVNEILNEKEMPLSEFIQRVVAL